MDRTEIEHDGPWLPRDTEHVLAFNARASVRAEDCVTAAAGAKATLRRSRSRTSSTLSQHRQGATLYCAPFRRNSSGSRFALWPQCREHFAHMKRIAAMEFLGNGASVWVSNHTLNCQASLIAPHICPDFGPVVPCVFFNRR